MHILIDHNSSPLLADCLHPFIRDEFGGGCFALRDRFPVDSDDATWIAALDRESQKKGMEWCFVTADRAMLRNKLERALLQSTRIPGFFLRKSFKDQPLNLQLSKLFQLLPEIQQETSRCHKRGIAGTYEIPAQGNRLKTLI